MKASRFEDCARFLAAAQRADAAEWPAEAARFTQRHGAELGRELLRFASLFFGIPPALRALDLAAAVLAAGGQADPRPAPGSDPGRAGRERFAQVYDSDAPAVIARLTFLDPHLRDWVLEHAYARGYAGGALELAERERLAVLALAVSACWKQCDSHLRACRRQGLSAADLAADATAGGWLNPEQVAALRERIRSLP
jgi:alkylhydroperoxidase/carboxymuconolactone decarboxylase family protein YurZ